MTENDTYDELAESVKANPNTTKAEKETTLSWARDLDKATVFTEEPSLMRRFLKHPEFTLTAYRTSHPEKVGTQVSAEEYEEEGHDGRKPVYSLKGHIPVACLKVSKSARKSSGHADVVSSGVL